MEHKIQNKQVRYGTALIIAMIFVMIFASLSVSLVSLSGTNIQIANNQHKVNEAYTAAQSGLECAKRLALTATGLGSTNTKDISADDADTAWANFLSYLEEESLGGKAPAVNTADEFVTQPLSFGPANATFQIRFSRPDSYTTIKAEIIGASGQVTRKISIEMEIGRSNKILEYAIASRSRIWVTGDSTIDGDIYSSWNLSNTQLSQLTQLEAQVQQRLASGTLNSISFQTLVSSLGLTTSQRLIVLNELLNGTLSPSAVSARCISLISTVPSVSPLNMTNDSAVLGTINTCWTQDQIELKSWQLETLDEYGNPIDNNGEPLEANYDERFYSEYDEIQGYHEGINYGVPPDKMAGMSISDYNTDHYTTGLTTLSTTGVPTTTEYFPHNAGDYTTGPSGSLYFSRRIYDNQTLNNTRIPSGTHALFKDCTFTGVLYIDCSKTSTSYNSYCNNIRFDNCTFNGTIITRAPQPFDWRKNCLYFTGAATFNNQSAHQEATILAPHFNVNLGNTNSEQSDDNTLKGAIVGGIVDVRGNAKIEGTIISMFDTSGYTSGYVTNIGATLTDGGSETVEVGDIGTIEITPDPDNMLPSGISSPLVIKPTIISYSEGF